MKILFLFGVITALQVQVLARNDPINTRTYGNFGPNAKHCFKIVYRSKGIFLNKTVDLVADAIKFLMAETRSTEQPQVSCYHTSTHNGATHKYFQHIVNGLHPSGKRGSRYQPWKEWRDSFGHSFRESFSWIKRNNHCRVYLQTCFQDRDCCSHNCKYVNPTTGCLCFPKASRSSKTSINNL